MEEIGNFHIAACRTQKGKKEIPKVLERKIKYFYDEEEAFAWKPNLMIVSNPTSLHLEYLLKAIDYNIDAFIEKPVVSSYKEIKKVADKIKGRKNEIYVGFNLRFHPLVREVSKIIRSNRYGRVLKADLYVGEYLPSWHPYEDYRVSYAAKKELGGGVLRTLSHEIDLGQYWFGEYHKVFSRISKISSLDIDVDDNTDIIAEMKNGTLLRINMDYLNPVLDRKGRIFFERGLLDYNFTNMAVTFTDYENKEELLLKIDNYDSNTEYRCQMEEFVNKCNGEICTLEEGINVIRIIDICEESSQKERMLRV